MGAELGQSTPRFVVLDTETTGLEPAQGHRVIEVAGVELLGRRVTGAHFHAYLKPDRDSDPGALEKHGLTTAFLSDKPRFEDIADGLLEFLDGATLIIHNAAFDVGFLDSELRRCGRPALSASSLTVLDTLLLARELHPGKRNSLDALCERYAVDHSRRTFHGALLDSQLLAEVYLAMTRGQESLVMDLEPAPPDSADGRAASASEARALAARLRVLAPEPAEQAEHAAVLASIEKASKGKCIWLHEYTTPA